MHVYDTCEYSTNTITLLCCHFLYSNHHIIKVCMCNVLVEATHWLSQLVRVLFIFYGKAMTI